MGTKSRILVTGAAGFIGSNLSEKLLNEGYEVIGLDNFDPYYSPDLKRLNLNSLLKHPSFSFIEADIRDRDKLSRICIKEKPESIAHLAAMAGVRNAVANPKLYVDVDLNGTQNLMDAAVSTKVHNFVMASTSSVYGSTRVIPFVETDSCDRPLQPYAAAKRSAELLGYTYSFLYGLKVTVCRLFTVYGPRNRPDMMAFKLMESITKGIPVQFYGAEKELMRDWTFIDDITDGFVLALKKPQEFEIFNFGRGEPVSVNRFIKIMEKCAAGKANLVPTTKPPEDMDWTYADISKARRLLGFKPSCSIEEGVQRLWDWYHSLPENAESNLEQNRLAVG